ncbi:unnamed protein product [Acanthoscelides obtectus]|uniref:Uncharacterized protein n=1 Tax=Acanthoscelides obtectus TaxID=200917 RepID=A0A9P0PX52_ACAOB|nr:unnamed protein product [Acanthoscelides obtectus]CAK1665954.1 SCAN domain-containing protein 3 [Acanthoscelides obtectus]
MAVAAAGPVLTFNPKENEWEVFFKRLEQYFIVHGVTEEADKRAHLLYSLSEEAYILLENLCMPQKPEETPYQDIVQLLSNYYGKTAVVWVERQKFYSASKSGNETALEWSVRLKGLARYCNFGQQLESKLTDIFVTQFNPGKVRTELFSLNENTTLNNAVEKAKIIEATLVIRDPVGEVKSEVLESDVFRITQNNSNVGATGDQHQDPQRYHRGTAVPAAQRSQGGTRRSGGNSSNMALPQLQPFTSSGRSPGCFRCGRNHNSNVPTGVFDMASTSSGKKRTYKEAFLQWGFTSIVDKNIEKPQCVLCNKVLNPESMKPSKLKEHFAKVHKEFADKNIDFFKKKERILKSSRMDSTGNIQKANESCLQASYKIAYRIARNKKPHTIGEDLIKPCLLDAVALVIGEQHVAKIKQISLSNTTIQSRICEMSADILATVISEIKESHMFALQLDESTDVASCSQLLVFTRYIKDDDVKEEYLFCKSLPTTTRGEDVFQTLKEFIEENGLDWLKLIGTCTDGAGRLP